MLSCKDVTRLISESMDHRLPLPKRIGKRLHLLMCRLCARYLAQFRFLKKAAARFAELEDDGDLPVEASLSSAARERIQRAILESRQGEE